MDDSIKEMSRVISHELVLKVSVVMSWVESNNYELSQLNTLVKQIQQNTIYLPTLVTCIITNNVYRISIY